MLELLAPAGSMEALLAAVQNGANAVYLGCGSFNARQGAKNFTPADLPEVVKYCHIRGVKVHLTVNTLVADREMKELQALVRQAAEADVDAFIVQDLGVARICSQLAPKVALHGSTQMTVHNLPGVQLCAALGMRRVVLSRELSREDIRYICRNSPIEIEVFAHGALCMSYSGQCYLSAMIGGRSGNRGRCAQPCRQCYGYNRFEEKYPLSLKDNCLATWLHELAQMGVASVKLEGRMKRPEYVASVTGVYRRAIDTGVVTPEMTQELLTAFNRQGFTDGYYLGRTGREMFGVRTDTRDDPDWLRTARASFEAAENALVDVELFAEVHADGSSLTVTDPQGRRCTAYGPVPESARTTPLDRETLAARLCKTGGTPYRVTKISARLDPGLTLSAASINALRREALNQLTALRSRREKPALGRVSKPVHYPGSKELPALTVQVVSREQITQKLLKLRPALIYVPLHILAEDPIFAHELNRKVRTAAVLPRVAKDAELPQLREQLALCAQMGIQDVLVGSWSLLALVREARMHIRGDFGLNIYNSVSCNTLRELSFKSATLSFEMTLPQIRDVSKGVPCEIFAYGRLPLMLTENCLIRGRTGECTCSMGGAKLIDKTGADFPVLRDGSTCRSVLYNGKKLSWLDRQGDLARLGLWAVRLSFTTENPREVDSVLAAYLNPPPFDPGSCTRGLYLRGLEQTK